MLTTTLLGLGLLASPALADGPIRPDLRLTPGAARTTDAAVICVSGYSTTKNGRYVCQQEADAAGLKPAANNQ